MMTTSFFGTVGGFTSHKFIIDELALGPTETEELLTFRIEGVVERHSPSRGAADPNMMSDERQPDPQLPACETMNTLALLNPSEYTKTEGTMPINQRCL